MLVCRWTTLPFVARIDALCLFDGHQANHVLLNEYEPGGGILPHTDGPRYFPRVAILSCLSACRMKWRERAADGGGVVCTRWLERRSLVVFDGAEYTDLLHGTASALRSVAMTWHAM